MVRVLVLAERDFLQHPSLISLPLFLPPENLFSSYFPAGVSKESVELGSNFSDAPVSRV